MRSLLMKKTFLSWTPLSFLVCFFACAHLDCSDAFVYRHSGHQLSSPSCPILSITRNNKREQYLNHSQQRDTIQYAIQDKKSGDKSNASDNVRLDSQRRESISRASEDGSPLGVAIALLGSIAVFLLGDDDISNEMMTMRIFTVFCTASIAVGFARLVRYLVRNKEKE